MKRQSMCADDGTPVGLYLGTTQGEVWASRDEAASFDLLFRNLPQVHSLTWGETG